MSEGFFNDFVPMNFERISPEQIESRDFVSSLRGYDPNEVKSFLHQVAASYRSALQDAQMASIALEDAKQTALLIDERARHADMELAEAKALREETAKQLEEAQWLYDQATAQKAAAEKATADLQRQQEEVAATPTGDPYQLAAKQLEALMRTAGDNASTLRRDAEEILEAARLDAEKTAADNLKHTIEAESAARILIADAEKAAQKLEMMAADKAALHEERAAAALAHSKALMDSMQMMQASIQNAVGTALNEFQTALPADLAVAEDESTKLAS